MRKILITLGICILPVIIHAGESSKPFRDVKQVPYHNVDPVYQARTANSFTLVATSTPSATFAVFADSAALANLLAYTTYFVFSESDRDTTGELISIINGLSGVTCTRVQGSYSENPSTQLTEIAATTIGAGAVTFASDNILGMSYIASADTLGRRYNVVDVMANATFATGTTFVNIYDGTTTSDTQLRREKLSTSAADGPLDLPETGHVYGTENTAIRYDVVSSSWITDGYINITSFLEDSD